MKTYANSLNLSFEVDVVLYYIRAMMELHPSPESNSWPIRFMAMVLGWQQDLTLWHTFNYVPPMIEANLDITMTNILTKFEKIG